MLLKQLPSIVCALAATWLGSVDAQDSDTKTDVKSIPVCILVNHHTNASY